MECRGCATENLTRRGRAAAPYARLVGLILLGVLGGCSTLSPQIFSDRLLVTGKNAAAGTGTAVAVKDANADVEKAKAEIETVQRRYLTAVSNLSKIPPRVSAALIGISSFALFKALTGGSTDDIAGAGVAGSAAWAYGTTMTSRPRQLVYIEGARALNCAVVATEPYNKGGQWRVDLDAQSTEVAKQFEELRGWRDQNSYLRQTRQVTTPPPALPALCRTQPPNCEAPATAPVDRPQCLTPWHASARMGGANAWNPTSISPPRAWRSARQPTFTWPIVVARPSQRFSDSGAKHLRRLRSTESRGPTTPRCGRQWSSMTPTRMAPSA